MSQPATRSERERSPGSGEALLLLEQERDSIVSAAAQSIRLSRTHYDATGRDLTTRRLDALFEELLTAVSTRDLSSIVEYARQLAAERFRAGYDLSEVQSAFNALEEAAWSCLCVGLRRDELAIGLGVVSTVMGAAKDALAREYVSLASRTHVPSLDMRALFTG